MKRSVRIMILAGTLVTALLGATEDEELTVTVRVYNYAGVENDILRQAHRQAARILARAGAGAEWIDCPESPEEAGREPACAKPLAARELVLKLLPGAMARKFKLRSGIFGFALPESNNRWLGTAFVFVQEAERLAFYGPFSTSFEKGRAVVLGHLIAHEIGHLLLGTGSHGRGGIMSFPWNKRVLNRLGTAHLNFSKQEVELIRDRLGGASDSGRPDGIARSQSN